MNNSTITIFIIVLTIIRTLYDVSKRYKNCYDNSPYVFFVLFIHALIVSYMFFGWLYKSKLSSVIFLLVWAIIFLHWATNNGKCFLTEKTNEICGYPEDTTYNPLNKFFSTIVPIFAISVSIYKLIR
jgi:hypothetical protein